MSSISETYFRNYLVDEGQISGEFNHNYQVDDFTGDGSTVAFTLNQSPTADFPVLVYVNKLLLELTTDYSVSGTTLTFVAAPANLASIQAVYWY